MSILNSLLLTGVKEPKLDYLKEFGLNTYEQQALGVLIRVKLSTAEQICRAGNIPTSKIYLALARLIDMGFIVVQNSRPKVYGIVSKQRFSQLVSDLADARMQAISDGLQTTIAAWPAAEELKDGSPEVMLFSDPQVYLEQLSLLTDARDLIFGYINLNISIEELTQLSRILDQSPAACQLLVWPNASNENLMLLPPRVEVRGAAKALGMSCFFWDNGRVLMAVGNGLSGLTGGEYFADNQPLYDKLQANFLEAWYTAKQL